MSSSESISTQTRTDLLNYLRREIKTNEEFTDKLRALIILVQCSDQIDLIKEAIQIVKELHQGDHFTPETDRFLQVMMKQRQDFAQLNKSPKGNNEAAMQQQM